jgi:hypothetical protein
VIRNILLILLSFTKKNLNNVTTFQPMAEVVPNKKGFKIIKVSLDEVQQGFGGLGICDWCNGDFEAFLYIPVLNSCYCQQCYNRWTLTAVNYPSDSNVEMFNYNQARQIFNL